tara:strand:- start:696 stop:866 length:171 start_codon:yes stop_codon:yes gene_type:complete
MTYSYKCQGKCGKIKDHVHGMNERPTIKCCNEVMKRYFGTPPAGIHGANSGTRSGT